MEFLERLFEQQQKQAAEFEKFKAKPIQEKLREMREQQIRARDSHNEKIAVLDRLIALVERHPEVVEYQAMLDAL